ncbi:hypothetical protein BWI97_01190 [Siphonobacter sp. BAB-5405]|uniref:hypothetical protein n=1 Tax=Siphonobacter sp. BAB-5405 TaxID=1864825 RepID=UPI000C80FEBD|nr:hypothetical protein [Siphonobacter sp. BAB-5405]PMD99058.1 hypothetical protein BWI97_01190 [Siphonobacter sp. BAB-5405]
MVYTATSFQSNRQLQKTIFAQLSDPPLSTPSRYGIRSKPYQWGDDIVYYELLQEQGLYYLRVPEPMEGKQAVFTRYYLLSSDEIMEVNTYNLYLFSPHIGHAVLKGDDTPVFSEVECY